MLDTTKLIYGFFIYRLFRYSYFHVAIGLVYFQSVGLSLSQALSLESIYYITKAVSDVPGGYFADRIGRKTSLITGSLLCAAAYGIMGLGSTYAVFALAEIMLGVAMSLATTSDSALLYDELEARGEVKRYEQVEGTGWAMRNLGFGAASAVGAWIAAATSLAVPFLISAVVISVSVLFVLFFLHEPHFHENRKKTPWFSMIGRVLTQPGFFLIILFFAITFIAVRIGFWAFQPMLEYLQVELGYYGVLFGIMLGISLLSALRVRWVKTMTGGPWSVLALLISVCFIVLAAGAYLGGIVGLVIVLLGFAIHSVAQGVYDPVMRKEINTLSEGPVRASTMAVATMLGNIGFAVVAPVYGWSVESYGQGASMLAIGLMVAVVSVPLCFAINARAVLPVAAE
ncbi:MAG: MFS transporter [Roseibium sp.]|uniref:MFS transporter n=1 Tax=Roseibium sp. TaxID=1936156 RepID=UPI00260220B4|nr:MFS transporter [Roseibium sp.]MCV0428902.1 MFS transporter [Roseibium sp.]